MTVGKQLMICVAGMSAVVLGLAGSGWYVREGLGNDLTFATSAVGIPSIVGAELGLKATALPVVVIVAVSWVGSVPHEVVSE